jgi:SAM-dependent methyltransferase
MPHRWRVGTDLHCDFDALPFESASLDLVLLPHSLELADDAHALLREVERVLRPEGRLIIFGLNPASLWGLRQNVGRLRHGGEPYLPRQGEFIGYWRLRDWLKLLSFDVEAARFGIYRPPLRTQAWLDRWQWVESVGSRWWPVLGAVYFIQAIKRVHGMRLVGLARNQRTAAKKAPAVALNNHQKKR